MLARPSRLLVAALLGLTVLSRAGSAAAQSAAPADERVIGNWQLNIAKSKFAPGPPYKGQFRTYERSKDGVKATLVTTYADGQKSTVEYTVNYDSLEYPVTGSPLYDAIRLKKIDAFTSESVLGHAGMVFAIARRTLSEDGKTMTILFESGEGSDKRFRNVMVYDKQP